MSVKKQRVCKNCNKTISKEAFFCFSCKIMLQKQKAIDDIIGKKFNRLTCVKYINSHNNKQYYEWQCDCGRVKEYPRKDVVAGGTKSCGCLKSGKNRDFSGLEKHNYKVIKKLDKKKNYRHLYECLCKCGKYFELSEVQIVNKTRGTKSCGCLRTVGKYKDLIPVWYINRIKTGATLRNLEYTISLEDMYQCFIKQGGRCALTDIDLSFSASRHKKQNASLDRIDNNLGYTPDNIQWIDKEINMLKNKYSVEQLIMFAERIVKCRTNQPESL